MSHLFVELYFDEDVDVLIAEILRARGYAAITVRDADRRGRSDVEQLDYAIASSKTLLTHNIADFVSLAREYSQAGREHPGIILAQRRNPYELADRLLSFLNQVTSDEMHNQLRYI